MTTEAKTVATLSNTNGNVWHLNAADGRHLCTLTGSEAAILGPASACLVADHGLPPGEWVRRGPGRHSYQVPRC